MSTAAELLAAARARIAPRLEPGEAAAAAAHGALIVDLRCADDRRRDGVVPGSLHVPRTVLEWRADAASDFANPHLADPGREVVLLCTDGYSSSLAADALLELGFARATDVVGGFRAWRTAGLPVRPAAERDGVHLPGMGSPEPVG